MERAVNDLNRHHRSVARLSPPNAALAPLTPVDPKNLIEAHTKMLPERLAQLGAEFLASDSVSVLSLLDRDLEGRRPFNEEGKKGFRDTLIWEAVFRIASERGETVTLVTSNKKNFCSDGELHQHLAEDLDGRGLPHDRIQIVEGLDEFNRRQAELHLGRLVDVEEALESRGHAKLSLSTILEDHDDVIADELSDDWNARQLAARLADQLDGHRQNIRVDEVTCVLVENADIDGIEVVKLEKHDVSISFIARFEIGVRVLSDAELLTKHDFDDFDRADPANSKDGFHHKEWATAQVKRIATLGGVRVEVTAHGLKGTNKTLAMRRGRALDLVSKDAGRTSTRATTEHYIAPGTIENVNNAKVHEALASEPLGKIETNTFPIQKKGDSQGGNPQ